MNKTGFQHKRWGNKMQRARSLQIVFRSSFLYNMRLQVIIFLLQSSSKSETDLKSCVSFNVMADTRLKYQNQHRYQSV